MALTSFGGNESVQQRIWNAQMQTMAFVHSQRDADEAELKVSLTITITPNPTEMQVNEEKARKLRKRADAMSQGYARLKYWG